jgi:5'-3' exonuclease
MKPLIDGDILLYEIGHSSQKTIDGKVVPSDWDFCQKLFDDRIKHITTEVEADEPPIIFLNDSPYVTRLLNKRRKMEGDADVPFVPNFRDAVAQTREYKGTRKPDKPYHYKNLINHVLSAYDFHVDTSRGIEADDAMCIYQSSSAPLTTIICSRDKDLKQVEGWHYGWECGRQPAWGPILVDRLGFLEKTPKGKVRGGGSKFFYYQMLTGDTVDNIVGAMGRGPAFAYNLLKDATSEREMYELTSEVYVKTNGEEWEKTYREMADLLWMIREVDSEGRPVLWKKPEPFQQLEVTLILNG